MPRLAGVVFGPWLLTWQPGWRSTVCRARQAWFLVPGCFARQPGKVCCSVPFPPSGFFSRLFILTVCLGSLAATRSGQGGLWSAALGGRSFWSPGCNAKQPGGSTVRRAQRARLSVPGCSRSSQGGGLRCAALGGRCFWSLPALQSSQAGLWSAALGRHGFRFLATLQSSQERFSVPFPFPLWGFFLVYLY